MEYKQHQNTHIQFFNNSFLEIEGEPAVLKEIDERFTFTVENYWKMKNNPKLKHRLKNWDGKIRLLKKNKYLYFGLLTHLTEYLELKGYQYTIDQAIEKIHYNNFNDFECNLQLRDYQQEAVEHVNSNRRSVIVIPTSGGKSLVMYHLFQRFSEKCLIIVPTIQLVEQLYKDFVGYGADPSTLIRQSHVHDTQISEIQDGQVLISTYQSLKNKNMLSQFDTVIGDECHLYEAKTITSILENCVNAVNRIGLTGSLNTKTHNLVLEGLFGPIQKITTIKKLIEDDYMPPIEIKVVKFNYKKLDIDAFWSQKEFFDKRSWINTHQQRNSTIAKLACSTCLKEKNTIVMFRQIDHGQILLQQITELAEQIKNKLNKTINVLYVDGNVELEEREEIREISESNDNVIIVASYGTFSTGINIKNIHNLIFASPTRSYKTTLQSIGRSLRKNSNKTQATIYDIVDILCKPPYTSYTVDQFNERYDIYTEQNFDVTFEVKSI